MTKIQIKRGLKADVENLILSPGELAVTLDTQELYVGNAQGEVKQINTSSPVVDLPIYEYDGNNTSEQSKALIKELVEKAEKGEQYIVLHNNIVFMYNEKASNGDNFYFSGVSSEVANNETNDIDYRKFTEYYFYYRKSTDAISNVTETSMYVIVDPEQIVGKDYIDGEIPTDLSQLVNDEGFITNAVDDLTNYYLKSEVYTREEVNNIIGSIESIKIEVITDFPEEPSTSTIYLKAKEDAKEKNIYDEYIYANDDWELIGDTSLDLSNYYTKEEADEKFATTESVESLSQNLEDNYAKKDEVYTKDEIDTDFAKKEELPDMDDYLTKEDIEDNYITADDLEQEYAKKDEIPDLNGYLKEEEADEKYAKKEELPDMDEYLTTEEADSKFATKEEIPEVDSFITEEEVDTKLEEYYTKEEADEKYVTEDDLEDYPSSEELEQKLDDYYTKSEADNTFLKEHQSLDDYAKKSEVETLKEELEQDYVKDEDLSNYLAKDNETEYTPEEDYNPSTKKYVDDSIKDIVSQMTGLTVEVVSILPGDPEENVIYLQAKEPEGERDYYDEYMYIQGKWELIGTTKVDLNDYYTKEELAEQLQSYLKKTEADEKYADKDYVDNAIEGIVDNDIQTLTDMITELQDKGNDVYVGYVNSVTPTAEKLQVILQDALQRGASTIILRPTPELGLYFCHVSSGENIQKYKENGSGTIYFTNIDKLHSRQGDMPSIVTYTISAPFSVVNGTVTVSAVNMTFISGINSSSQEAYVLHTKNEVEYTPTGNYNPATKKYVDDKVGTITADSVPIDSIFEYVGAEIPAGYELYEGPEPGGEAKTYYYDGNNKDTSNIEMFKEIVSIIEDKKWPIIYVSDPYEESAPEHIVITSVYKNDDEYTFCTSPRAWPDSQSTKYGLTYLKFDTYTVRFEADTETLTSVSRDSEAYQLQNSGKLVTIDNTEAWTPSQNYGLVHKKYVDDKATKITQTASESLAIQLSAQNPNSIYWWE